MLITGLDAGHGRRRGRRSRAASRAALAAGALAAVAPRAPGIAGAAWSPCCGPRWSASPSAASRTALKNVLLRTLIHERVPEALRGRAFAAYNAARNGAELGALALGGLVVGAIGARVALLASGLGPALIGLAACCS